MSITEDEVAACFAEVHRGEWAYCVHHRAWFKFDGAIWRRQEMPLAFDLIRQLASRMSGEEVKGRSASFCKGVEIFAKSLTQKPMPGQAF
jgi:hypothetical protein